MPSMGGDKLNTMGYYLKASKVVSGLLCVLLLNACSANKRSVSVDEEDIPIEERELEELIQEVSLLLEDTNTLKRPVQYLHPRPGVEFGTSCQDEIMWQLFTEPLSPFTSKPSGLK
jgi:hypothetical protein